MPERRSEVIILLDDYIQRERKSLSFCVSNSVSAKAQKSLRLGLPVALMRPDCTFHHG